MIRVDTIEILISIASRFGAPLYASEDMSYVRTQYLTFVFIPERR